MSENSQDPQPNSPSITRAARDFVKDANKSGGYVKAVNIDVAAAVSAVEKKISRDVGKEKEPSSKDTKH